MRIESPHSMKCSGGIPTPFPMSAKVYTRIRVRNFLRTQIPRACEVIERGSIQYAFPTPVITSITINTPSMVSCLSGIPR